MAALHPVWAWADERLQNETVNLYAMAATMAAAEGDLMTAATITVLYILSGPKFPTTTSAIID